jgi:hypothetical protein
VRNENKHVSLWSSKHSDRNELAKMNFENNIDADDKAKIRAAFSTHDSDERVTTYTPVTNSPVFARIFG